MTDSAPIRLHLVGNAHIDPVWLWRWQEGYAETQATFRSALDRLREFPGFVFTAAGASAYRWVEENDPGMFREIAERVREGRWAVVGGWWVQPDCNLPGGESFARHGLLAQRWFLSRFGRMARTGYNVDSFGHNAMLPQILLQSGMDGYVFLRPQEHELPLPAHLFLWEGADGSRVPAHRISMNYASWWGEEEPALEKVELGRKLALEEGTPLMVFYGVGNHGGGPTIRSVKALEALRDGGFSPELVFSDPDRYFDDVRALAPTLPVFRGGLHHHAAGCYSAHSGTKRDNRRAEARLLAAEAACTLATSLLGAEYPADALRTGWEKVLFNQFHDALGGCGSSAAIADLHELYGQALTLASESLNQAVQKIAWNVDTSEGAPPPALSRDRDWVLWEKAGKGAPLLVFNPTAFPLETTVRVGRRLSRVALPDGRELPVQVVRGERMNAADRWETLVRVPVPALGYQTFWISSADAQPSPSSPEPAPPVAPAFAPESVLGSRTLSNGILAADFDPARGGLCGLRVLATGASVLAGPASAVVVEDAGCDTWGHDMKSHRNEVHRYREDLGRFGEDGDVSVRWLESGPVRRTVRVTSRWGRSVLRQDFHLDEGADFLEVDARITWAEEWKRLALSFPVGVEAPRFSVEIPYGFVERPADGDETAGQRWVDVSGRLPGASEATAGLTLVSADRSSFSCEGGDLRVTLVRSAPYASYEGVLDDFSEYMDLGVHETRYRLQPHAGPLAPSVAFRSAMQVGAPVPQVLGAFHGGPLPLSHAGIETSDPDIFVTAVKRAEDGTGRVVRCHETDGVGVAGGLALSDPPRTLAVDLPPFGIRSWLVPDDPALPVQPVDLLEFPTVPSVPPRRNPA